jgi:hypothetical protein
MNTHKHTCKRTPRVDASFAEFIVHTHCYCHARPHYRASISSAFRLRVRLLRDRRSPLPLRDALSDALSLSSSAAAVAASSCVCMRKHRVRVHHNRAHCTCLSFLEAFRLALVRSASAAASSDAVRGMLCARVTSCHARHRHPCHNTTHTHTSHHAPPHLSGIERVLVNKRNWRRRQRVRRASMHRAERSVFVYFACERC